MMKVFFKTQFDLPDRVWWQLSLRWGLFFLIAGTANEIAWRQLSDDDWVTFRVLVMAPPRGCSCSRNCRSPFTGCGSIKTTA